MGAVSRIHSSDVGSCSTKVSAVDTEKTDSPLVRFSSPVGSRYCNLMPKNFAKPWPTLVAVLEEDILILQQKLRW